MFKRILNWLLAHMPRRRGDLESFRYDAYHPGERRIFSYFDGGRTVHADPMELYRRLMDVWPSLSIDMRVAESGHKDAEKAYVKAVGQIRGIFGLKPFAEGGLTEAEANDLLDHFLVYTEAVKKNSSPWPTSPTPSAGSGRSSGGEGPPTSSSSGSGSTDAASSTAEPASSPSGPA